jgi:hypothetical protein
MLPISRHSVLITDYFFLCFQLAAKDMVATAVDSSDVLPDLNVAAEFYAHYDIRDKLGR